MATFKQLVGFIAHPATIALLFALAGFLLRRRRPRVGVVLLGSAVVFAYAMSTSLVGAWLLGPLERQYPPLTRLPDGVQYVVVLGSSYSPRDTIPVTAALDDPGLARLVEGVRLQRLAPAARLVVSGGSTVAGHEPATGYALLSRSLGVPDANILPLTRPLDTRSEAAEICRLTAGRPFVLVTSASHMPRAVEYLRRAGCEPVPAPTDHRVRHGLRPRAWFPSSGGLRMTEDAIHEYLGWLALLADTR